MEHFITVAVFTYPHETTVVKLMLDDAGIPYTFENATMTDIFPMYSLALGGIRLKVHPDDFDYVNELLDKLNGNPNLKIV